MMRLAPRVQYIVAITANLETSKIWRISPVICNPRKHVFVRGGRNSLPSAVPGHDKLGYFKAQFHGSLENNEVQPWSLLCVGFGLCTAFAG